MMVAGKEFCKIRRDLVGYKIPITSLVDGEVQYIDADVLYEYRWVDDTDGFQVFIDGVWYGAESVDFDF